MNKEDLNKEEVQKELGEMIGKLPSASFKNKHGEVFTLHATTATVFMSGDEVDAMVDDSMKIDGKYINIFNEEFSVWNIDEIKQLGEALIEVAGKVKEAKEANESKRREQIKSSTASSRA